MSTKRNYVTEAYETFIENVKDIDPTDPVKAIEAYFEKNATDELKARVKTEGKSCSDCWEFIVAVAKKIGERSCHIDPGVVYAIAMHYFEDVPRDWCGGSEVKPSAPIEGEKSEKSEKSEAKPAAPVKKAKVKKAKVEQLFLFNESEAEG